MPTGTRYSTVSFVALPDANHSTAIAIDLVRVREAQAATQLSGLTAAQWFERRDGLMQTWPDRLEVESYEIAPGSTAVGQPSREGATRFVFAGFQTPGVHRLRLDDGRGGTVILEREGMVFSSD